MRVLHSADWHINAKLGRHSLNDDIRNSLQQIAVYLECEQIDVLLVAGDIIEKSSSVKHKRQAVQLIKEVFQPFLGRGGTMLMLAGNHDDLNLFRLLKDALDLVAPPDETARIYIVSSGARQITLPNPTGGEVQFLLMGYPSAAYLTGVDSFHEQAERNQQISSNYHATLQHYQSRLDERLPSVLVTHVMVRGTRANKQHKFSELSDVILDPQQIDTRIWSYVALGHIHDARFRIGGAEQIRYAGSIIKMDRGERAYDHSVTVFEIGASGLVDEPRTLPLDVLPINEIVVTAGETEVEELSTTYPAAALTHCTIHYDPDRHRPDMLSRQLQKQFPRLYRVDLQRSGERADEQGAVDMEQIQNVAQTVRGYLKEQLNEDKDSVGLLELAEQLLREEGLA